MPRRGIGKVFANHPFGQPGRTAGQHSARTFPENWFPFAHAELHDPLTGRRAGLLRGNGFDPLVIEANTATEYWHKGASLPLRHLEGSLAFRASTAWRYATVSSQLELENGYNRFWWSDGCDPFGGLAWDQS